MTLLDYNVDEILFLLKKTGEIFALSCEVGSKTESATFEGFHVMNHDETLNMFYQKMMGRNIKQINSYRFIAWYDKEGRKPGSIKGPEGYINHIPDCISSVVLSSRHAPEWKHDLLRVMMLDLLKLEALDECRKSLFSPQP